MKRVSGSVVRILLGAVLALCCIGPGTPWVAPSPRLAVYRAAGVAAASSPRWRVAPAALAPQGVEAAASALAAATSPQPPSLELAAATVDPTSFLTGIFGSLLNTPVILAVPILAALGVGGVLVFLLILSSQPAEDD